MITDHDIAALCADIYSPEPQAAWTERVLPDDGVAYGAKDLGTADNLSRADLPRFNREIMALL